MKQRLLILMCVGVLLLSATTIYSRGTASEVQLGTFTAGGGVRQSPNYRTHDVIGQWVAGSSSSANNQVISGLYWSDADNTTYLPFVRK